MEKKKLTASRNHAEDEAYLSSVVFASYFILLFIVRGHAYPSDFYPVLVFVGECRCTL